ncbi:MAG: pyridoxamine 5'-phosphate oxidase family protein [Candidatus Kapaibacterium sp.]
MPWYESHEEILYKLWHMIEDSLEKDDDPLHYPVFATVNGEEPSMRKICLRDVSIPKRKLYFHTDIRSDKIDQLRNDQHCSFLFYSKEDQIQARMWGNVKVHYDDSLADRSWDDTGLFSRKYYLREHPPGSVSKKPDSGLPDFVGKNAYTAEHSEAGRKYFAVIESQIYRIDFLYLRDKGHIRSVYKWDNGGFHPQWLIP